MTVYAVMRGTALMALYKTEDMARRSALELNAQYVRGKRYEVVPMKVRG